MTLTVYHLKTCDTCRKAIKALREAGHDLMLIDVRADGVLPKTVESLLATHGWEVMLNRRSTTWRGLDASDKEEITNAKAAALIAQHPTLMKRPIIVGGETSTVGWTKDVPETWIK